MNNAVKIYVTLIIYIDNGQNTDLKRHKNCIKHKNTLKLHLMNLFHILIDMYWFLDQIINSVIILFHFPIYEASFVTRDFFSLIGSMNI